MSRRRLSPYSVDPLSTSVRHDIEAVEAVLIFKGNPSNTLDTTAYLWSLPVWRADHRLHSHPRTFLHLGQTKVRNLSTSIIPDQNVQALEVAVDHGGSPSMQVRAPKCYIVHQCELVLEIWPGRGLHVVTKVSVFAEVRNDAEFGERWRGRRSCLFALGTHRFLILLGDAQEADNRVVTKLSSSMRVDNIVDE